MSSLSAELRARLQGIRLLCLDVDGVLTDGNLYWSPGGIWSQRFSVRDGYGIKLMQDAGIEVAILSGGDVQSGRDRAQSLGIARAYFGIADKPAIFRDVTGALGLTAEQAAFCGDELVDVPLLRQVGFAATVPDAVDEARAAVHYVTVRPGGNGAVRELCDLIPHAPQMSQHPLVRLIATRKKRVVGLMSGTSLDGVDAALVEVDGWGAETRAKLLAFQTTAYSGEERAAIHRLFTGDARAICEGSFRLGERFATAALDVIAHAGLRPRDIDLIGSHGQTIWHQPPSACVAGGVASTLQIGEPAVIAARTGLTTVADFRVADVALGGEGAPLVPWCDWALYRQPGRTRALQNIGGIANVAVVTERLDQLLAFDNGPGNMMIDALAPAASGGADSIDRDGAWSARGRVQDDLLARLIADDDFLPRPPPKSTGRERYGANVVAAWAAAHRDRAPVDLLATLVAYTAEAIARSYRDFVLPRGPLDEVLVAGGGAHNRTLMAELGRRLAPLPVRAFDEGVSADAKEAVAFAVLAVQAIHAEPANVVQVTGASRAAVLGKICLP